MTRAALIRDAARCSRDEGTQWRDRLERWRLTVTPRSIQEALDGFLFDVPQVTSEQYNDVKDTVLGLWP